MKEESRCHQDAEKHCNRKIVQMLKTQLECKLNHLHGEAMRMQSGRREHAKLTKNPSEYEIQVCKIKQEVAGMKKNKVALVAKKKEESRCHQEAENRCIRKTAQMLKGSEPHKGNSLEAAPRGDGHYSQTDIKCKLNHLQGKPKKMQSTRREHAKLTKNPSKYKIHFRQLKQEVAGMKKNKVTLAAKMKEESSRHEEAEK
nr:uncharacterized protein LOC119176679 [Rhipicephalus microplus]